ncbi:MAG: two-component regulator propeller domain-containing protein, partial [Prevotella sp.]
MRKHLLLTLCLLVCWAKACLAQSNCTVTHYDEFSGMAQWYVTQIVQDKQNMIWLSTWNGLNRYDGYRFETFKSRVGDGVDMPSDRIMDMMLDKNGNLLCFVDGRVFLFDVKTCKYREIDKSLERQLVSTFNKRHDQE